MALLFTAVTTVPNVNAASTATKSMNSTYGTVTGTLFMELKESNKMLKEQNFFLKVDAILL